MSNISTQCSFCEKQAQHDCNWCGEKICYSCVVIFVSPNENFCSHECEKKFDEKKYNGYVRLQDLEGGTSVQKK